MERIVSILLCFALCFSICGCSSSDYSNAEKLLAEGKYEEAKAIYTALGEYKDAKDKIVECKYNIGKNAYEQGEWATAVEYLSGLNHADSESLLSVAEKEKGMSENADYAFLADLETSILYRMKETNTTAFIILVNTELAYVEKYEKSDFYDKELQKLAKQYIEGLNLQKKSVDQENTYEQDLLRLEGLVKRFEALSKLYNNYDFLKDNAEFVGTYVSQLDYWKNYYNGYVEIEKDINKQVAKHDEAKGDYLWNANRSTSTLESEWVNNTKYTYTITFDLSFYDSNGTKYATGTKTMTNIAPGQSYVISVYVPDKNKLDVLSWECHYSDITK